MTNDIETLPTALYVKIDDELAGPRRLGRPPVLTDSERVCLALAQSLLGFTSETHWLRFAGRAFETLLGEHGITLLRPSRKDEKARYGEPMLKKVRQLIESVNDTLKGRLDLEDHGGRSCAGVAIRVAQRILAMASAMWHNNATKAPITRSLIAYAH
ncbi:hypothetical protein [Streptomyces cacaoi]|uniref:hypothetical protein n=1 Tax=Streptomyces cacaoi TaxID=1898 RepID=UPI00374A4FD1